MKIAFKLSTPEAVEYANGHKETNYGDYGRLDGDKDKWFHIPAFNGLDYLRHLNEWLDGPCSGYTDVTPNFLEDYYRPWKDKLASVQNREVNVVATLGSGSGFTDEQLAEIIWLGFKSALNAARMYPESKHTFSDHKEYLMGEAKKLLTPKQ
jgi:hypothetical protein